MNISKEQILRLFEAAKRSLLAADLLLKQLAEGVTSLETDIDNGINVGERAIPSLLSAISFVDFAHRFASLLDALPISKKSLAMRKLGEKMTTVEIMRNHLQHLRGEYLKNEDINYPILGALSWTKGNKCYQLSWSQHFKHQIYSITYDTLEKRWMAKYQYTVKDVSVSLDCVLAEMFAAFEWVMSQCRDVFLDPLDAQLKWGETQTWTMNVQWRVARSESQDLE